MGSIPITRSILDGVIKSSINSLYSVRYFYAHIAQSVEHFLGKEEVTGSNPVVGTIVCYFLIWALILILFCFGDVNVTVVLNFLSLKFIFMILCDV